MICKIGNRRYWSHHWSKWEWDTTPRHDDETGREYVIKIQVRHCERCSRVQAKRVPIEG